TPFTAGTALWNTSFNNTGSELILNPTTTQQVTIATVSGAPTSNFSMSSGSWDIQLGSPTAGDKFVVTGAGGTASLTGGTLNISRINGYSPGSSDAITILQAPGGASFTPGAVTLTGDPGWGLRLKPADSTQLQLYRTSGSGLGTASVPEPSSAGLVVMAALG